MLSLKCPTRVVLAYVLVASGLVSHAAIPSTELYPFPGDDLTAVRLKSKAECSPELKELVEAWGLYREFQGSWMPGAAKPQERSIARLDQLKAKLEAIPNPVWFSEVMNSPQTGQSQLAEKIGDKNFEIQRATPEYQMLKALAIIYLTEHELDREGSAQTAGKFLTALSITHPWDWQLHGLYSRLLVDARLNLPAWQAARQSIFLNPDPTLEDLKFFAFIGSIAAKDSWPQIQDAIRQATTDDRMAGKAILESEKLFSNDTSISIVQPKKK